MSTTAGLIVFLVLYALVGAVFAFNLGRVSDRVAGQWWGKRWLSRQIGRDNPMAYRAFGLMALAFGVTVIAWILISSAWHLPPITAEAAVLVLGLVAASCVAVILVSRRGRRSQ